MTPQEEIAYLRRSCAVLRWQRDEARANGDALVKVLLRQLAEAERARAAAALKVAELEREVREGISVD